MQLVLMKIYALQHLAIGLVFLIGVGGIDSSALNNLKKRFSSGNESGSFFNVVAEVFRNIFNFSPEPECRMTVPELIQHLGYPVEVHHVTTKDGYILELHRIPSGRENHTSKREPVLLMHGVFSSSFCFVANLPDQSIGYVLADSGYDVWLGNNRGNTYSTNHSSLDTNEKNFWAFSFEQIAEFDIPAMIDYILHTTNRSRLDYIGHSQGATGAFALFSSNDVYRSKINIFIAIAPPTTLANINSPTIIALAPFSNFIKFLLEYIGIYKISLDINLVQFLGERVCIHPILCKMGADFMNIGAGIEGHQYNKTRLPIYLTHSTDSVPIQTFEHFLQNHKRKSFSHYDHGVSGNLKKYQQETPPAYDITKSNISTAVICGTMDYIVVPEDVRKSAKKLPKLIELIEFKDYSHSEFFFSTDDIFVKDVLRLLETAL